MPKYYKLNNSTIMYLNTSFGCVKTNSITSTLTSGGSGYTLPPTVNVKSNDGGSGYAVNALLTSTSVSSTNYTIVSGGTNYAVNDALVFNNGGTGGSGVSAVVSAVSGGVITALNFTSQGSGYYIKPPTLSSITSASGTGANITFNLTPTSIGSLVQVSNGNNYSVLPTLTLSGTNLPTSISTTYTGFSGGSGYALPPLISISNAGNGTGFSGYTLLTATTVSTTINIINGGTGYVVGDAIVFDNTGTGGSGVSATVSGVSGGAITALTFTSQGSGYNIKAPVMTTITSTAGKNALITFSLTPTSVASIVITNGGIGYTTPSFAFTPVSGGTGVSATPVVVSGTQAVITPSFYKTFTYTWNGIPPLIISDLGKLSAINIISTNFNTTTAYTYRILGLQYDSRDSFFSDYGQPILSMAQNVNVCSYGSLGDNGFCIILTPQTISSITISVDDDITTKSSGQSANINFVIALQIEEYDPNYTEVGDVYAESASRLKLNY